MPVANRTLACPPSSMDRPRNPYFAVPSLCLAVRARLSSTLKGHLVVLYLVCLDLVSLDPSNQTKTAYVPFLHTPQGLFLRNFRGGALYFSYLGVCH